VACFFWSCPFFKLVGSVADVFTLSASAALADQFSLVGGNLCSDTVESLSPLRRAMYLARLLRDKGETDPIERALCADFAAVTSGNTVRYAQRRWLLK